MQAEVEAGHRFSRDTQGLVAWLALGCIAIAVATGIALTRSITRPLATALGIASEVSAGRLDIAVVGKGHDETAQLIRALAGMAAALARDRAALHESERRLAAANRELEARNAELERFTYVVSHDLKSPLVTVRGFLSYVERDAQAGRLARVASDLARIRAATDRMAQLLEDLLELSRTGRIDRSHEDVPLEDVVREARSVT